MVNKITQDKKSDAVPIYRTPQGTFTDLKASDEVYNIIYENFFKPLMQRTVKEIKDNEKN